MPLFGNKRTKSKDSVEHGELVYGEGSGSVMAMDLPPKPKGWRRVLPKRKNAVLVPQLQRRGSDASGYSLAEGANRIYHESGSSRDGYSRSHLHTINEHDGRMTPHTVMEVPHSHRGSNAGAPMMMMAPQPVRHSDATSPPVILNTTSPQGSVISGLDRQRSHSPPLVYTQHQQGPYGSPSPYAHQPGMSGPRSEYSSASASSRGSPRRGTPPPAPRIVHVPETGKTYQEYSGNVILVVDEDAELEIGNEETGFIPYSQYLANPKPEMEEEVFMVHGNQNLIFQDDDGNDLRNVTGTPEAGLKLRGTYVKNVDGSFSVYP